LTGAGIDLALGYVGHHGPSRSNPSIVVIRLPSCIAAKVIQERTRRPLTCTVHAPHSPRSHPFFVPVSGSEAALAGANVAGAFLSAASPGGLARAGNARVRRGMIQLAWRFLLFQKQSSAPRAGAPVAAYCGRGGR
jgi:hypothetical protein